MTGSEALLHPPTTPLGRFGIATLVDGPDPFVGSMPMASLVNPITGTPTLGPLAVLVDFVAGLSTIIAGHQTNDRAVPGAQPGRFVDHCARPRGSGGGHRSALRGERRDVAGAV
jgi:hypothetical protein